MVQLTRGALASLFFAGLPCPPSFADERAAKVGGSLVGIFDSLPPLLSMCRLDSAHSTADLRVTQSPLYSTLPRDAQHKRRQLCFDGLSFLLPALTATHAMPSVDLQYPRTDFPADLECHPLLVVDFAKIAAGDEQEIDTLYSACTNLGFFYLKNFGFEDVIEPMFEMGKATFSLPDDELMPFEQGQLASYSISYYTLIDAGRACRRLGYERRLQEGWRQQRRRKGKSSVPNSFPLQMLTTRSTQGNLDTVQFINVSKDDALAYPEVHHRTYPRTVNERIKTVTSFVRQCKSRSPT